MHLNYSGQQTCPIQDLTPNGNDLPTTPMTREETGQNESSWQTDEASFLSVGKQAFCEPLERNTCQGDTFAFMAFYITKIQGT